jgi:anti-anti-sigma factor
VRRTLERQQTAWPPASPIRRLHGVVHHRAPQTPLRARQVTSRTNTVAPDLDITWARVGAGALLAPRGVLDVRTIVPLQLALVEAARRREALTIDLTHVEVRSPAGLALLLNALRRVHAARGQLRVVCPPGRLRSGLERAGLARPIDIVARLDTEPEPEPHRLPPGSGATPRPAGRRVRRPSTAERRSTLLAEATIAIEAHHGEPDLTLHQVARRIATSGRQLQRVFAELAGTTFRAELSAVRMQHAAELLQTSDLSVRDVAGRVGHRQAAQFANAFRRHHGMSPTAFRRAARR